MKRPKIKSNAPSKNKVKIGESSGPLSDDNLRALAINHKGAYERSLASKKAADAALRNCCKKIKAELGDSGVAIIKAMVELDSDEGEAVVMERIRAQAKAARWSGY